MRESLACWLWEPHPQSMLQTQDAPFRRFLAVLLPGARLDTDHVLIEDLTRLIHVSRQFPEVLANLLLLADKVDWAEQIARLSTVTRLIPEATNPREVPPPHRHRFSESPPKERWRLRI